MSRRAEEHKAALELYRQIDAYYASIRNPWLECITFTLALFVNIAVALGIFGLRLFDHAYYGQWLVLFRWLSLALFLTLDAVVARARHPVPIIFGPLNPERIYEKFAAQQRAWQPLLILMLPVTARLIVAGMVLFSHR